MSITPEHHETLPALITKIFWLGLASCSTAVEATRLHAFLHGYGELQRLFVSNIWREIRDLPPKIAAIDDGTDQSSISRLQINGASFVYSDSGESPWWLSDDLHGTQMAKMITGIDPYCKLFIAKVGETKSDITRGCVIEVSSAAFLPATQDKNRVTGLVDAGNHVGEGGSSRHYLNERSALCRGRRSRDRDQRSDWRRYCRDQ